MPPAKCKHEWVQAPDGTPPFCRICQHTFQPQGHSLQAIADDLDRLADDIDSPEGGIPGVDLRVLAASLRASLTPSKD